jgi:hypothetical protein
MIFVFQTVLKQLKSFAIPCVWKFQSLHFQLMHS